MVIRAIKYSGVFLCVVALAMISCRKNPPVSPRSGPPLVDPVPKVFLMYDNIGDGEIGNYNDNHFTDDVAEAGSAIASGAMAQQGHRVIVFHRKYPTDDKFGGKPTIYELVRDRSVKAGYTRQIIEIVPDEYIAALTTENINYIVGRMRAVAPEANHFGLAFGSHGMGWLPKNNPMHLRRAVSGSSADLSDLWTIPQNPKTRYLAFDINDSGKIDVDDFAAALDEWEWDFVIFDDCFMASVEALYEIRHLASWFLASSAEILIEGFPYDRVVKSIFSNWSDMNAVGRGFYDYYRTHKWSSWRSGIISVIKTSELDALAASVRKIRRAGYNSVDPSAPASGTIQFFEGRNPHIFWDLDDYMRNFAQNTDTYDAFVAQLGKTVTYKANTPTFWTRYGGPDGLDIGVTHHSGLTAHIPTSATSSLNQVYQQTAWYKAVFND